MQKMNDNPTPRSCPKCGNKLSKNNRFGFCNCCRDRSGANNPFYGKKHDPETMAKSSASRSAATKALWQQPEYRQKVISAISKPRPESFKLEQSKRMKEWYAANPRQREVRSVNMKCSWAEGRIVENHNPSYNRSKAENLFFADVQAICDDAARETIKVGSHWYFPDILIPSRHLIIEFYGNYWHANPDMYKPTDMINNLLTQEIWKRDEARIQSLEDLGYYTYTVWESQFKSQREYILRDLDALINWDGCVL